mgnify:CR=1 FL=1
MSASSSSIIIKPFFVYGTLLRNFRNYNTFLKPKEHAIRITAGSVKGFHLVHFNEGYPGMFLNSKNQNTTVAGEIIYPKDKETYEDLQKKLDHLEGYDPNDDPENNFYERKCVECIDKNGNKVICDTYICKLNPDDGLLLDGDIISWKDFMRKSNLQGACTDWAEKKE